MRWFKRYGRLLAGLASAVLLGAGLYSAYWWFYKWGPARHTLDPQWRLSHSERAYWEETQKGLRRGVLLHDDGFVVGRYGDKSWAQWIMGRVKPGDDMGCSGGHLATAMRYLTNQDAGIGPSDWLAWWEKNRAKSQEEWLADGFRQQGVDVALPLTAEDAPKLLLLLGRSESDHVQYNAFRALRDSGFDALAFAISQRDLPEDVARGLSEYAKYDRAHPAAIGLGILAFGKNATDEDMPAPYLVSPTMQITVGALVLFSLALGIALAAQVFRGGNGGREPRMNANAREGAQ